MQLPSDTPSVAVPESAAGLLLRFVRDDGAQDLVEYAFLAAFFGIAGYVALGTIAPAVGSTYNRWLDPSTGTPSLWDPETLLVTSAGS